jgi:phosphatidylserine/phosphatidylglycerophosphate/cardiolipin synthase-like enzyme
MPQFEVQYGDAVIADGFFLRRTAAPTRTGSYVDGRGEFFNHLSTFPERSTIKEAVLDLLSQAQRHIFFCNFLLQDEDVLEALLKAATRLRGHVYILTTLKSDDFAREGAGDEAEGDFESHISCVKQLTQQGLLVKARSDCHAKFMTIDDEEAIVTSANAVPTCYGNIKNPHGGTREANAENGVLFRVSAEVRRLSNFFRAMWRDGCNYYVAPDRQVFEVQQIQIEPPAVHPAEPAQPADEGEVLWTAPGDGRILRRFIDMIQRAQHRVSLSTWVIKGMDTHELGDAIRQAGERGVQFQILVRGMNWRDDHRRQCYLMSRALGARGTILGDYWNHSKALVMDNDAALMLTANMDAQHGLDRGIEVGFYSRRAPFVMAVSTFLDRLASDAAFEFVADPTQAEVAARYGQPRGPRLGGIIRISFDLRGGRVAHLIRRWSDAASCELVRVKRRSTKGHEELLLLTNQMAIYARQMSTDRLVAYDINDKFRREDGERFDSYLGRAVIAFETPN